MTRVVVTDQKGLDAALAAHRADEDAEIIIDSPQGVWLEISDTGSALVHASGSASVIAWDSVSVHAWDSVSVRAGSHVAVHLHSAHATVTGGVVIDLTQIDLDDTDLELDQRPKDNPMRAPTIPLVATASGAKAAADAEIELSDLLSTLRATTTPERRADAVHAMKLVVTAGMPSRAVIDAANRWAAGRAETTTTPNLAREELA